MPLFGTKHKQTPDQTPVYLQGCTNSVVCNGYYKDSKANEYADGYRVFAMFQQPARSNQDAYRTLKYYMRKTFSKDEIAKLELYYNIKAIESMHIKHKDQIPHNLLDHVDFYNGYVSWRSSLRGGWEHPAHSLKFLVLEGKEYSQSYPFRYAWDNPGE
ncbi:hypothetical protein BDV19DRAFT_392835 [Aspergillus venezuelensis]